MISFTSTGSFNNTERFLKAMTRRDILKTLKPYGQRGVDALASATPVDSGLAANSWEYEVSRKGDVYTIQWLNTDVENGAVVVILLQYGHGVNGGGWVEGRDFINPAIIPIFDQIASDVWREVTNA